MGWDKELKDYRYYLKLEKKLSDNTVRAYLHDLSQIADYMEREFSIAEPELVTAGQIEMFLSHLYDTGVEKATQARVLSGIKSFFNYLMLNDRIEALPTEFIDAPKIGRKLPDVLSFDEVNAIIGSVDLSNRFGHRNKAMLETLYSCGLRVSELVTLRISDLFFKDGFIRVIGKGDKQRLVPVSSTAVRLIEYYLDQRASLPVDEHHADTLFLNNKGKGLTRVMVFHIIRECAKAAGITKKISPHTFRHSFATHLLAGGASIRQVQEMLGHESILTTEIYTHLDRESLAREYRTPSSAVGLLITGIAVAGRRALLFHPGRLGLGRRHPAREMNGSGFFYWKKPRCPETDYLDATVTATALSPGLYQSPRARITCSTTSRTHPSPPLNCET